MYLTFAIRCSCMVWIDSLMYVFSLPLVMIVNIVLFLLLNQITIVHLNVNFLLFDHAMLPLAFLLADWLISLLYWFHNGIRRSCCNIGYGGAEILPLFNVAEAQVRYLKAFKSISVGHRSFVSDPEAVSVLRARVTWSRGDIKSVYLRIKAYIRTMKEMCI